MPDIISLVCPSCGGKLQVSPSATSLTCQHCGNEHLVKHEAGAVALEAYARCPQCGRNDKAEKASAVIASHSQEISGTEQKNEVVIDGQGIQRMVTRAVPFTRKQISILGQKLAPPDEPTFEPGLQARGFLPAGGGSPTFGILAVFLGALLLLASVCLVLAGIFMLISQSGSLTQDTGIMMVAGLVVSIVLFLAGAAALALGIFLVVRARKNKHAQLVEFQQKVQAETDERQRIQSDWKRAMERWDQLYYCARDDCVFIPGENTSSPVSKMKAYLSK